MTRQIEARLKELEKTKRSELAIVTPTGDPDLFKWAGHEDRLYSLAEVEARIVPGSRIIIWDAHTPNKRRINGTETEIS